MTITISTLSMANVLTFAAGFIAGGIVAWLLTRRRRG